MSCTISTSHALENVWMLRNAMFRWFAERFAEKFCDDAELVHQIEMAVVCNGVSLDLLYEENPRLTVRLRDALRLVASEIASGKHVVCNDDVPVPDQLRSREVFANLVAILDRAQFKVEGEKGDSFND